MTRARPWLEALLSGTEPVGFPWSVMCALARLSPRPQLCANPLAPAEAFGHGEGRLAQPCSLVLHPTERHLAAPAIEHGGEVCSAETDVARFRGLRWTNPLA